MSTLIKTLNAQTDDDHFLDTADDLFTQLVQACRATGKAGTFTLQIGIRPAHRGGAMAINRKATIKEPKQPIAEVLMFANEDGQLFLNDPRQVEMDLRIVPTETIEPPRSLKNAAS